MKLPALEVAGTKVGSRKMMNFAEKLASVEDRDALRNLKPDKFPHFEHVVVHLLEHGALKPVGPAAKLLLETARSSQLSAERLVPLMRSIEEHVAAQLPEKMLGWAANAVTRAPEMLREVQEELCEPLRGAVALARSQHEELAADERARALDAFLAPLRYGRPARLPIARGGALGLLKIPENQFARELARIGGPDWVAHCSPQPLWMTGFPLPVLLEGLRGRAFSDRLRVLGSGRDLQILAAADEPASVFFDAIPANPKRAHALRLAGMAKANAPSQIPAGAEDQIGPYTIVGELGIRALNALGAERLDAWGTTHDDEREKLRNLWLLGADFRGSTLERLLEPRPFESVGQVESWAKEVPANCAPQVHAERLRAVAEAARATTGLTARALRRWAAALLSTAPEGAELPEAYDKLLEPGLLPHISYYKATARALEKLPASRAEAVLVAARPHFQRPPADHETVGPDRELCFFCEGLTDDYVDHVAKLIVDHRDNELLWSRLSFRRPSYTQEAGRLGKALARRLAGQSVTDSFLTEIAHFIGAAAEAQIRENAGATEAPTDEIARLAQESRGPKVPIYLLHPTENNATQATPVYAGGRPVGFRDEDIPSAGGQALAHAITFQLACVPELAARYPSAATLSLFVEAYTEELTREQEWVMRTAEELAAAPGDLTGAHAVEVQRVEVPTAIFDIADHDDSHARLRSLIYDNPGYLLGGPLWLQDGPVGVDDRFLAQFDERLADINLGDTGIAYSYVDRCTWQCH